MTTADRWPTVLVVGPTGAGKTSLLQAIFGADVVPESRIGHGAPATQEFETFESRGLRLIDSKGLEPGEYPEFRARVAGVMRDAAEHRDPLLHVHVVWYCVPGCGARVTSIELDLIRDVLPNALVLITKSDVTRPDQLEQLSAALRDAGVPGGAVLPCSIGDPNQLAMVLSRTSALFESSHRAVLAAVAHRRGVAEKLVHEAIRRAMAKAGALSLIPLGLGALGAKRIRVTMVKEIARAFGREGDVNRFWSSFGASPSWREWVLAVRMVQPWLQFAAGASLVNEISATGHAARTFFAAAHPPPPQDLAAIGLIQATRISRAPTVSVG